MILTLRIENFDQLDDGGQVMFTVDQRGASIGRKSAMDWVLPDPSRIISGHHFDVQFADNVYWLIDVSMNGTFLHGQRHRLEGAYQIRNGDRFVVGHYILIAELSDGFVPLPTGPQAGGVWDQSDVDDDPWAFAGAFDEPINPHGQIHKGNVLDDVGQSFVPMPRPQNPEIPNAADPHHRRPPTYQPEPAQNHSPQPEPSQPDRHAILQAFCEGAKLQLTDISQLDAETLARELGQTLRVVTTETMRMLRDRANVKQFTRGGDRTMRSATGNNPLKFMPDEDQALDALFFTPRDGFLAGSQGVENALSDIREHQIAVFAALQPALAKVLEGLSPEEIEGSAEEGKIFSPGSKRARSWDKFVAQWDEKAKRGDHGMLDAFLQAFAQAYRDALSKTDQI